MSKLTPGQKAIRTKRAKYGEEGLSEIARRAYRTREQRRHDRLHELEVHLTKVAGGALSRARKKGWEAEDDLAGWALAMMSAQRFRCALSGVPFSLEVLGRGAAPRPFAPSIDRRDVAFGYTADNIRIICWATNLLLGTWGDGVALRIATGIAENHPVGDD